jgi:hypothetical protein
MRYHINKFRRKIIILHCHTSSYHCASIIADCSNTGQWKNHISYLLSSLQYQHHQHILDHDRSITARWIVKSVGASRPCWNSPDSWCKWPSSAERRSFGSAAGSSAAERGRRGRAAAEASAASAAGADAQPADPPAAARGPSCKGNGCKTENVMIGMNALIDLEYANADAVNLPLLLSW